MGSTLKEKLEKLSPTRRRKIELRSEELKNEFIGRLKQGKKYDRSKYYKELTKAVYSGDEKLIDKILQDIVDTAK